MADEAFVKYARKKSLDAGAPANAAQPSPADGAQREWASTNARLASHMPLSALYRIFAFTSGDGNSLFDCPVAVGTLTSTVDGPLNTFIGKVPLDIIARSDIGAQTEQTGQFPEAAWAAMNRIDPTGTANARAGLYRTCVRPYHNPWTHTSGCFVLLYRQ